MKRWLKFLLAAAIALTAAAPVLADIALPSPSPQKQSRKSEGSERRAPQSRMTVLVEDGAREARLEIPQSLLGQLRAEAVENSSSGMAATTGMGLPPLQTIMMGLFLSLSVVMGGVYLLRSRRKAWSQGAAVSVAALLLTAAATSVAIANAVAIYSPPALDPGSLPRAAPSGETLNGNVRLVVAPEGSQIRLVVPKHAKAPGE
ncbi:MAG TPA: hypothetical protein VF723_04995 [Pyrinomonadaceae bacterium]|jgi:hypothetical protein